MEVQGTLEKIFDAQNVTDKFKKRVFVVSHGDNPEYMESSAFEFQQDKCSVLDKFTEGQEVNVEFNLRGRKWTNKQGEEQYFNTLQAWKINEVSGGSKPKVVDISGTSPEDDDDLPF